jgi:asparagine synthase (glutamine-hydrolysing)
MGDTIAHRGPDGSGFHNAMGVGLAHRRLSIIDLEGGAQPLANEDGTIWIAYNGEIYNFAELRIDLEKRGHRFRTRSDTEVIVHGYEEYGISFARRLHGMFAFALHDMRNGTLLLFRDHVGIKPLFYSVTADRLVFGSEIKAVLAGLSTVPSAPRAAVQEYLLFRHTAWDRTMYEGVQRLPPGHAAVWRAGKLSLERYWWPGDVHVQRSKLDEAAASEELERNLSIAVRDQMIAEVPLGTFCSGGLDSGLVTSFAAQAAPHPVESFSVGFAESEWDESSLARDTTRLIGTNHHSVVATADELAELLPTLLWFNDEPLSQPNSAPLYVLSRLARQHVTVALTGEGADELFAGYPRYRTELVRDSVMGAASLVSPIARGIGLLTGDHRVEKLGAMLGQPSREARVLSSAFVEPRLIETLTGATLTEALATRRRLAGELEVAGDSVASLMRYELTTYLGGLLERMDRMAMAHGLEGRVPFLHVPLLEWGLSLPPSLNVSSRASKKVVRRLASRRLPASVMAAPKSGFGLPLAEWFRGQAFAPHLSRLRSGDHGAQDVVDGRTVQRLVSEHLGRGADHSEILWLLVNLMLWREGVSAPARDGEIASSSQLVVPPVR